ncbi:MAG TPA: inositol monophosphatase family protein [Kofleriaceae bacterium]|nr:inositol monophosphatase family protein [Kofleriaceae bacterium]
MAVEAIPGADGELGVELRAAMALARAAGEVVLKYRGGELGVELKAGDEPVTLADKAASELIVEGLAKQFSDPIVSEELELAEGVLQSSQAGRLWLIDPIDGTKDFIRGSEGFSVMIGLLRAGRPVLGVVHQPAIDPPYGRTFIATPDGGSHVITTVGIYDIHVSTVANAADARLVASASHRTVDIDKVKTVLGIGDEQNVGSIGVKLCLIALGLRDLYVNPVAKTKVWDTCAPEAILAGAGGRISDLNGAQIDYTELRQRRGLVASNGVIHDEVVAKLGPLFKKKP